jgi:CRP-like cAMP-binding protein
MGNRRTKSDTVTRFLEETPWMRAMPAAARNVVLENAYETDQPARELVTRRGEPTHSWMGVMEGHLKVVGVVRSGRVVLYSGIPPGSWVGESSIVRREPRRYDIVVAHVPTDIFRWLVETCVEFDRFVIAHINERLTQFMAMVEADRMDDPVARLCGVLIWLYSPVLYPRMPKLVHLSQEELGELAGLTRQRTNGAVRQLAEAGLVVPRYGGFYVTDLEGLQRLASTLGLVAPIVPG